MCGGKASATDANGYLVDVRTSDKTYWWESSWDELGLVWLGAHKLQSAVFLFLSIVYSFLSIFPFLLSLFYVLDFYVSWRILEKHR